MSESDRIDHITKLPLEVQSRLFNRLKQKRVQENTGITRRNKDIHTLLPSFSQQRLWFLEQLVPGSPSYNVPMVVQLEGKLRCSILENSLAEVIHRHEILRTTFVQQDGQVVQVIAQHLSVPVSVIDIQSVGKSNLQREIEIQRLIAQEAILPFDLGCGPLLRVTLLRLTEVQHLLLITMHHIISDGWSIEILIREVTTLYTAFIQGNPSPLPTMSIQYADFALWQRQWLQGEVLDRQLTYWREQLKEVPLLQLPTDYPRPQIQSFRGAYISFQLSEDLHQRLLQISQQQGVTLYMMLMAALQILLWRYTGQKDLVIGMPVANRTRREIEPLIGFFVNTLVLRTQLREDLTIQKLLQKVQEKTLEAHAHQDLPFEYLVEQLQPERDPSRNPFFQIVFMLLNTPPAKVEFPGITLTALHSETTTAKFDLSLLMNENPQGLTGKWEYNTDLFKAETIERMHSHWLRILEAMVTDLGLSLARIPLLSKAEEKHLLFDWNDTSVDFHASHCLPLLVEQQVERTPDAVAAIFENEVLTYHALDQHANHLAHRLCQYGVRPERLVGICMSRSLEMLIALLAVLKTGGAYVPLDPTHPQKRLRIMAQDAHLELVLTQLCWLASVDQVASTVITVQPSDHKASAPPTRLLHPDNLAYVIYTSGSTGKPKGVMISHQGICNRLLWAQQTYQMRPQESILHKSPLTFDISIEELFWPLMVGAHTVIARPEGHRDSEYMVETIAREQIGILRLVTPMLSLLVETENLETCASLRLLICGGETLVRDVVERFYTRLPRTQVVLHNFYGATEASVDSTYWECESGDERGVVPIGYPMANVAMYVLGQDMQPTPVGVIGDLYIGGSGLARGYLGQSALTAERFVPNPFSSMLGGRLYQTGDQGRFLPNGALEFVGRKDTQVKVRGYRIELGEIEAALNDLPEVREAVVVVREEAEGDQRLAAYIVRDPGASASLVALQSLLHARLPAYMLPSSLTELSAVPLTANGKVDRRGLPAPAPTALGGAESYLAPRSPLEEVMASIWSDVLGVERIGLADNFFSLGGHSLLATQVISRIQEALHIKLPLHTLFAKPTIAGMVSEIQVAAKQQVGYTLPPLRAGTYGKCLPLPPSQQGLWFLEKLVPGNPFYNVPIALHLEGWLNCQALIRSINEVICRHETLRTTFTEREGQSVQEIHEYLALIVPMVDLQGKDENVSRREVQRLVDEDANQPFDLLHGPLLRATIVRINVQEYVLLVNMHHIVTDGWSMGILAQELSVLYSAYTNHLSSPLPQLPIQYADFVLWQREWLQGEILEQQVQYWQKQLADVSTLNLPTDHTRPKVTVFHGAQLPFQFPAQISERLRRLSQQTGVTLFMTLLAAFQLFLSRYSGQEDIVVGTPIANRQRTELEPLIGFLVNTLILRTRINNQQTIRDLLRQVREVTLGAYMHQDLSFVQLVEKLQPERDLSRNPLLQIVFGFHNTPAKAIAVDDLVVTPLPARTGIITFDLGLSFAETPEGLKGIWEYSTELFEEATIKRMHNHFQVLVEAMVDNQEQRLLDLPFMPFSEQHTLLYDWNKRAQSDISEICFQQLFEDQVRATPESIAVVSEQEHLTYRALNERSNQLAHYLQSWGVGPEVMVGLCVERSLEAIVAILGILKAGGAYVPLDPAYPQERLEFLLQDAAVGILLTQERLVEKLPVYPYVLICLDTAWVDIAKKTIDTPVKTIEAANLAYMIYTSGSSGLPKGVQVTHRGLHNLLDALIHTFHVDSTSRVFQFASLSFDPSVLELAMALFSGATLCLNSLGTGVLGSDLVQLLQEQAITHLALTPSALATFPTAELPALKTLIAGGEVCSIDLVSRWSPERSFFNAYGPTEATVCVSAALCVSDTEKPSIGRPLTGIDLYVLDRYLRPVPIGVPGELYIGSVGLARGYWQRAELTAEHFVPHPFSAIPGSRLYKTGDMVRYRVDGALEFLGRVDHQVKVRGYRIELGEIETALSQHPAIEACAVDTFTDAAKNRRLVGYIVPDQSSELTISALRQYLSNYLPSYMIPSRYVFMASLPLSTSNKINYDALPPPSEEVAVIQTASSAPRTMVEIILVNIWKQVLGIEVGIYDNFFAFGGDSILCVQVVAQAAQMGLAMTPSTLFQYQTIAELASVVTVTETDHRNQEMVVGPVPLTPIQHWFFEQHFVTPHRFAETVSLHARKRLNPALLSHTLHVLRLHHDALRLHFTFTEQGWQQDNQAMTEANIFSCIDLSSLYPDHMELAIEHLITQFQGGLDLQNGPLLRVCLFDLGSLRPQRLYCFIHHLLVDVRSLHIFIEDIQTVYMQLYQMQEVHLPAKTSSYQRWSQFLTAYAYSDQITNEIPYWLHRLSSVKPLPVDWEGVDSNATQMHYVCKILKEEETRVLLQSIPQTHNIHLHEVLLTALALTISRWTGEQTLLLDMKGHGREDLSSEIDVSRTIGWFTSLFPVYLELKMGVSLGDALVAVKEQLRGIPQRGIGYGILRYLRNDAPLRKLPQAEINFNYLGQFDQMFASSSLFTSTLDAIDAIDNPQETQTYHLTITALVKQKQLHIYWTYKSQQYEHNTISRLAEECLATMYDLVNYCQCSEAGKYTPSDFPDIDISQKELDDLLARLDAPEK